MTDTKMTDKKMTSIKMPDMKILCVERAEMKRIKPEVPVLLFSGVGSQTPFRLRFFDLYLQNHERPEKVFEDLDA
jgi:hypothetical protein